MLMNWQLLEAQVGARLSVLAMQGKRKEGTVRALLVSLWEPVGVGEGQVRGGGHAPGRPEGSRGGRRRCPVENSEQ